MPSKGKPAEAASYNQMQIFGTKSNYSTSEFSFTLTYFLTRLVNCLEMDLPSSSLVPCSDCLSNERSVDQMVFSHHRPHRRGAPETGHP